MTDFEQQRRDLMRRIVEKVASDPEFRDRIVDDPEGALSAAGFNRELQDLQEAEAGDAEVSGYAHAFLIQSREDTPQPEL